MHHSDAGRLEIIIALPLAVRVDEELHTGILIHIASEIRFTGGRAFLKHVVTQHEFTAGMEGAQHCAGLIWGHFGPIAAVEKLRLAFRQSEKQGGGVISVDIYTLDYHNL